MFISTFTSLNMNTTKMKLKSIQKSKLLLITNSRLFTNTENVVNKAKTMVHLPHQKLVPLLLLIMDAITSCSHMNIQSGDADAVNKQITDQLTICGMSTQ